MLAEATVLTRVGVTSPLATVAWESIRPAIPGIVPEMSTVRAELPHVIGALPIVAPPRAAALHDFGRFGDVIDNSHDNALHWLRTAPTIRPLLHYVTEHFDMAYTPLVNSVIPAATLGFAHVPPTEIMAYPRAQWQALITRLESVHGFYFHVSGYYYAVGFRSGTERDEFVNDFMARVLPAEARSPVNRLPFERFFAGGWHRAGEVEINGERVSLFLMTPHAFRVYQNLSLYEAVDFDKLSGGTWSEPTRDGSHYVFARDGSILGFITSDGRCFRTKATAYPAEYYNTASHAAILRRQTDPFGLGTVPDLPEAQLRRATDLVQGLLRRRGIFDLTTFPLPQIDGDFLARQASVRLPTVRAGLANIASPTPLETAAAHLSQGIEPWQTVSDGTRRRHIRFITIQRQGVATGFIATDGLLLHKQIADIAFPSWVASRLQEGDATMPNLLRGGVLELEYGADGRLQRVHVKNKQFQIVPTSPQGDAVYITMSDREISDLKAALTEQLNPK